MVFACVGFGISLTQVVSSDFCHWGAQFGYTRVGQGLRASKHSLIQGSPSLAQTYREGPHPDNAKIEAFVKLCFSELLSQLKRSSFEQSFEQRCFTLESHTPGPGP